MEGIDFDYMGENFIFVNRETECKKLLTRFGEMDLLRGKRSFDKHKRDLLAPLCIGLPGLEKTRFARIAAISLVQKATGVLSPTLEQMLESSVAAAEDIWPDDRSHDELLREIIFASYEDRNIRIALTSMPGTSLQELEFEIIVNVLVQWMKHRELRPEWEHLNGDKIISKLKTELRVLKEARFGLCSFCDVVGYVTEQSARAGKPALIINLDEAQNVVCSLQKVLEILVNFIIVDDCRMFVTVTGICTAEFRGAIARSNISFQPITLPVLTEMHMALILASVFAVEVDKIPPGVVDSMKWLGGVPRLLEYILRLAAKKARANTVQDMWEWLCNADTDSLTDIIIKAGSLITGHGIGDFGIPDDLLHNIFSIAVAKHPVRLSNRLTEEWTVEGAQGRSLMHWKGVPG